MQTLAITNQKGGVAKTTTAVTLAHGLALQGLSVLLIDLDAQGNCADALGIPKDGGLYRLLILDDTSVVIPARPGLDLITSDKTTVKAQRVLAGESFAETKLRALIERIRKPYDLIVIDTAPGAGLLQINAICAATHFIVPVSLAHLATVGAVDLIATVSSLKKLGAFTGQFLGVLPTLWDRTTNESQAQLTSMARHFGKLTYPPIPIDVKAREAPGHGKSLYEYAPDCRALNGVAIDGQLRGGYRRVVRRLMDEFGFVS